MRGRLTALLASLALVATACLGNDGPTAGDPAGPDGAPSGSADTRSSDRAATTSGPTGGGARFVRGLVRFDDCSAFLDHVKAEARDRVGPYGLDGGGPWFGGPWLEDAVEEPASEPAVDGGTAAPTAEAGGDDATGGSFTGTNVQVAGVDEPDIVKTDGDRILVVSEQVLTYVDLTSGDPVVTDRLRLTSGWGHELFFRGDRAFVFTNAGTWGYPMPIDVVTSDVTSDTTSDAASDVTVDAEAEFAPGSEPLIEPIVPDGSWGPAAEIVEVDLSDPTDLRIAGTMRIEGQYLSARAIDGHVRLAVSSPPNRLPWLYPQTPAGEDRAEDANRRIIDESTLDDWLPAYELTGPEGTSSAPLLDCGRAYHPAEFAGFDMVSVIDLDLDDGLHSVPDAVGVLAGGQTVASSTDRFYVATTTWRPPATGDASVDDDRARQWSDDLVTEIHAFAISPGVPTAYVASGSVPGSLLDQFSLDEFEGDLRVVHTDGASWDADDVSETFLTVLREDGDRLVQIGAVGGLGRGEQLYSTRLMGDVGFAVTFRQIDPFYVLDLSDPTQPRVAGELKIPGFSTYLHPVGDHLVLGVGQDATEEGQQLGFKLSLFDVSEPSDPREVSVWTLPMANSAAEWDHRAFQMWGSTAIVPVEQWSGSFNGAILFDLSDGITEIGRVSHRADGALPVSDCRPVDAALLTPDASDLYWTALDGRVQVCGPDDLGGLGGHSCERLPADAIEFSFWDDEARVRDLTALDLAPGDDVELCWPDGGHQESIQRSLVVDGRLYTVSWSYLQANDLDSLDVLAQLPLR